MLLLLWYRKETGLIKQLTRKQSLAFLGLSLSGVIGYNLFMLLGLRTAPAARAGIIYGLFPLLTWLAAWAVFHEKFTKLSFLGSLVCLGGIFLALSKGSPEIGKYLMPEAGDGFILLSLTCWVGYSVITTWLLRRLNPVFVTALTCIVATLMLLPISFAEGLTSIVADLGVKDWTILAIQGIFSTTLAFLWYCEGLEKLGAGKATLFLNVIPLSTILMATAILNEPLFIAQIIGAGMVCLGVCLAERSAVSA